MRILQYYLLYVYSITLVHVHVANENKSLLGTEVQK